MDTFSIIAAKIIRQQEIIIGSIALEQAKKVPGIELDWENHQVTLTGDKTEILNILVGQYKNFFGQASIEVCKDAAKKDLAEIPYDKIPLLLR